MQTIRHHRAMRNPPSIGPYLNHIPAHMPTDAQDAVLMARVIAHNALNCARRRAQSLDAGFHEDLARMDILVSVGMLDREFVEQAGAEVVAQFHAAIDALTNRRGGE